MAVKDAEWEIKAALEQILAASLFLSHVKLQICKKIKILG